MPDHAKTIFLDALEIPAVEERQKFLDKACGSDGLLRAEVDELLRHHQAFPLSQAPAPYAQTQNMPDDRGDAGRLDMRIGPYKVLQQIGEGGMGTVYMAEQSHPIRRKVALKLVKAGFDTRQVIARFEAERQALALMDHPNIARVHDAGTTETGVPYFVMELVNGISITKYCDERRLSLRERLELFVSVCHAVQHAHSKGIIHRDLKPSNVLIAQYDGRPVPKVIDFGLAKAAGPQLTDRTMFTQFGTIVGTLEYMSPEQADRNQLDVDTRSDIYSLGVLLYELLTGTTPLDAKRLRSSAILELLRIIKEEEPPKPSTRLSTTDELPSIAAKRNLDAKKLSGSVRGELDWIVMKALEKDRDRRYETANGLGIDVQRYLADEPVTACPPSAWYRMRKFIRRHSGPVLAALLIVLALVAGVVGTTLGLIRAEHQRFIAEGQRNELAQRNRALQAAREKERLLNERVRQIIEAITSDTAIEPLTREKVLRPEQREFLDKMIQYYVDSTQDEGATEQERTRAARAYSRMGRMNQILGRSADSEIAHRRAVDLQLRLVADFPARPEFRQELALSHNALGMLLRATGRPAEGEAAYIEAQTILKQLATDFPARAEFRQALAGMYNNLGKLFCDSGRLKEGEAALIEALEIRKRLANEIPDQPIFQRALAMSHSNLGWLFQSTSRPEKAEAAFRDAVAFQKQIASSVSNRPEFRMELAKYQRNLGNLLRDTGRLQEAEAVYGEALPIEKQLAADFPNRPEFRQELAGGHNSLGLLLRDTDRTTEAEAAYTEALVIQKQLVADFPRITEYHNGVAGTLFNLATVAGQRRDYAAARQLLDEAMPFHKAAMQPDPSNTEYRQYYRNSLFVLATSCAGLGDRSGTLTVAAKRRALGDTAEDAYEVACIVANCVPIVEQDDKLDAVKRQADMSFYADQAMAALHDAVAKGYKDVAHMQQDKHLDPLRQRDDFKKLVSELDPTKK